MPSMQRMGASTWRTFWSGFERFLRVDVGDFGLGLPAVGAFGPVVELFDEARIWSRTPAACSNLRSAESWAISSRMPRSMSERLEPRNLMKRSTSARYSALPILAGAGGGALVDGVEEAGAEVQVLGVALDDVELAGAKLEDALEELDGLAEGARVGERPEDLGPLSSGRGGRAGDEDAGEILALGDGEVGEGLVVDEADVEAAA